MRKKSWGRSRTLKNVSYIVKTNSYMSRCKHRPDESAGYWGGGVRGNADPRLETVIYEVPEIIGINNSLFSFLHYNI